MKGAGGTFHERENPDALALGSITQRYNLENIKKVWRRGESNPCPKWNAANIYERRCILSYLNKESIHNLNQGKAVLRDTLLEKSLDTVNSHPRTASCIVDPAQRQAGRTEWA